MELPLEEQIEQWKSHLRRRQAVDVEALEGQLREQVAGLVAAGLTADEAFLVAMKRMGAQLVVVPADSGEPRSLARTDAIVAFCVAVAAAVAIKVPVLFGMDLDKNEGFYARNVSLFVLPLLTGYFVWKRRRYTGTLGWLGAAFVAAAVFANVYPFVSDGSTEVLAALHLPIALWLAVGIAYAGGRWNQVAGRMDFIRFSGELLIYYVLIALGGGVFAGLMALIFQGIGIDVEAFFGAWLMPCGAAGAVVVASWLVEAKQRVIESMAPVLTRLFSPLFAALLVTFLGTVLWTGRGVDIKRDVLIGFDLLLVVVIGLLLYSISARDPRSPKSAFDLVQVVLVVSALLVDAVALWAIAARITEYGFTANRVAALGENVILLVNLTWSAVLYIRFVRGRGPFAALERWQTNYLPVYAVWAAIVVIVFPPLFRYV